MRWALAFVVLFGCDRVFGLENVPADAAPIDVPLEHDAHQGANGCADSVRDVPDVSPKVAACAGAWAVPGMDGTGVRSAGALCEDGWHVCVDEADAMSHGAAAMCAMVASTDLFATAQKSSAADRCDAGGNDDVFGCGGLGSMVNSCGPLHRAIGTLVAPVVLGAWSVGTDDKNERINVTKGEGNGGVICCFE